MAYWDALDGQAIRVLDEPCRLTTLAVHPGGQLLAVGGADGVIRLLDYDEGGVTGARRKGCCVGHHIVCMGSVICGMDDTYLFLIYKACHMHSSP